MDKKIKITTNKQFELLIQQLESKPSLAKGFHRGPSGINYKEDWEEIKMKLNSFGPPIRDSDGWQKVWRDFKCKLKKKLTHNKAELNATGGGLCKLIPLSTLEEAASNLLQFEKQFNPEGVAQGLQKSNLENEPTVEEICEEMPSTSAYAMEVIEQPTSRKRKYNDERKEFFEKHNSMQKEVFSAISKTMSEVKDCLKEISKDQKQICDTRNKTLEEIKIVLKETSRYQRKLYDVEEKKMKMMERQEQRQEELHEKEIEIKNIKLEIKKKELQALENKY